jgi:hypothetical protein
MMDKTFYAFVAVIFLIVACVILGCSFLYGNYNYHWKQQCAAVGGVEMENMSGHRICVKGPVQIVTIAVRPW